MSLWTNEWVKKAARASRSKCESLEPRRLLAAGDLDLTFDSDGKVTSDFTNTADTARGAAVQNDGKILAVVFGNVVRYNANGSLDSTFDSDGRLPIDFGVQS